MEAETLYDRLGGSDGIEAVVDDFYDRMLDDERMRPFFEDVDMERQRRHQRLFISQVAGGPVEYDGANMRAAHEHLGLTQSDFEVVVDHLGASLDACGVDRGDAEAVLAAVRELEDDVLCR
ncbi:group I truncated hemoglobin [Halorientalis halophila]|uniref:group I truncated hemoglobin n=1 Tax=Halorientalis halophila TaxID=3108499 RepID=UPI00300B1AAF